jgi:hypothetical protein
MTDASHLLCPPDAGHHQAVQAYDYGLARERQVIDETRVHCPSNH